MELSREILRNRHRLSERQVDDFLGVKTNTESPKDRILGMQQIGSFLEIAKLLKNQEIEFINLKGPLLSQRIYGDPIYRYSRDFDILVEPNQVNQTLQLLRNEGFDYPEFEWPESEKRQKIALHFLNQIEMVHETSGLMVEVHWKLFSTRITDHKKLDNLIQENVETVEFGGVELNRFSKEFELFYLIVHGGIHAWFRLKWLVDIHEMLDRITFNWEKFHRIISECNIQKLIPICNVMLQEYFPDENQIPDASPTPQKLADTALEQCRQPEGDPHITRANTSKLLLYRMKIIPSIQHKLDVLKVITFCKTDLKYSWLPPYKIVYYLFRPVGYLLRGIGVLR
ncbi:nucleotidyltransferase family protein [Rhodohalobacter sulfatireducens]|uniref:Nucleotidyltransferase family protein n=1 Tax=Rhodohalobacter sulfatireducens TaxID=2911366 RepID=A0ABS9KIB6_9BACT|nr:nucleotidyltransferase family protein [Rhodohalobacter sulfatireducens]MCG2590597.1 nucleotidyltransferase family protein [Rhodohalobacter sulfatireducens]